MERSQKIVQIIIGLYIRTSLERIRGDESVRIVGLEDQVININ